MLPFVFQTSNHHREIEIGLLFTEAHKHGMSGDLQRGQGVATEDFYQRKHMLLKEWFKKIKLVVIHRMQWKRGQLKGLCNNSGMI